jgi:hypothetical protein
MVRMRTVGRLIALIAVTGTVASCSNSAVPHAASSSPAVPAPAVSSIDHVVDIQWFLADSFDVTSDGRCVGRGDNSGIEERALVRFHGDSTDSDDQTTVTTRYVQNTPTAKGAMFDDGKTCVVRAVFAPTVPDPRGYTITFTGTRIPVSSTGPMKGMTPFGMANEPAGYGRLNIIVQKCRNLAAPPGEDCPQQAG